MDITRGSLDEITRPASSERWRPGSRVSLSNASIRNTPTPLQSSLEILLPDNLGFQDEDLEVEEYISPTEEFEKDEDYTSDIPCENNANVNHSGEEQSDHNDEEKEDNDHMDPKIKEAIKKMEKLDRILAKKMKREKDVKRERLLLEQKLLEELERAKPVGRQEAKESADNTVKFLALKPPPKHYEGILTEEEEVCFSPLFATQPTEINTNKNSGESASDGASTTRSESTGKCSTGKFSTSSRQTSGTNKNKKGAKKGKTITKKNSIDSKDEVDFIHRNIQLASDASNVIAMTDDEKRRLEDLLADVEMLGDDNKQNDENLHTLQLQSVPGIGYQPEQNDMQALKDIDDKLKQLMPLEDYESICSTPREINIHPSILLTHMSDLRESLDVMELGEKVLQENHVMRNQQEKLKNIEKELEKLQNRVEMEIISPRMSTAQFSEFYDEFTDVSSRATSETNSIALSSPRTPRESNPPSRSTVDASSPRSLSQTMSVSPTVSTPESENVRLPLPKDVLQRLLEEARSDMMGGDRSRLSTVREESEPEYSTTSRQSWDCMTNGNARAIMPSLSQSIIQDLIKNPRVTSHSLSSSRANSSLSLSSNTSLSNHQELVSVTSHYSHTESIDNDRTPVPDERENHTDNGKLASGYTTTDDFSGKSIVKQACFDENSLSAASGRETPDDDCNAINQTNGDLSIEEDGSKILTADGRISRSPTSGRISKSSTTGKISSGRISRSILEREIVSPATKKLMHRPHSKDEIKSTSEEKEWKDSPDENGLISNVDGRNQRLDVILQRHSLGVKAQAMLSRTDPEASASRAASATSTFRSDSQASTNTLISSSDFEYENQQGEFLGKESPAGIGFGQVPTPPKTGVPSRTRSKRSMSLDVNDSDEDKGKDDDGGKTFSPPFF
ncbi:uncharacterized protein [Antedon mediterranea]|uniref:uncharacterized protein n=1 Tax=Antedon mediterranea TaxID=105859 RepID=UPI003AF6EC55